MKEVGSHIHQDLTTNQLAPLLKEPSVLSCAVRDDKIDLTNQDIDIIERDLKKAVAHVTLKFKSVTEDAVLIDRVNTLSL